MGTFLLLSKSSATFWLHASEAALFAFGVLLVIGLIGEIKLPWPHPRFETFELLVIIAVAGELLGDAGVFVFSGDLQTIAGTELAQVTTDVGNTRTAADKAAGAAERASKSADKAKSDLINLAVCNAPRVISNWWIGGKPGQSYVDPLTPMAGQIVLIEFVPDAEARRAALNIARALVDAKWKLQTPIRPVDWLADGVSVQPSAPPPPSKNGETPNLDSWGRANDVAGKLLDFLHSYNWEARREYPTDAQGKLMRDPKILPDGAIRIRVGLYPAAVYITPSRQQHETERWLEEQRRKQEKFEAEMKRRWEDGLKAFPPERRARLEQAHEEWEIRNKKEWEKRRKTEMSNGPCQVLNPLF